MLEDLVEVDLKLMKLLVSTFWYLIRTAEHRYQGCQASLGVTFLAF
jgi:hypothetical protein